MDKPTLAPIGASWLYSVVMIRLTSSILQVTKVVLAIDKLAQVPSQMLSQNMKKLSFKNFLAEKIPATRLKIRTTPDSDSSVDFKEEMTHPKWLFAVLLLFFFIQQMNAQTNFTTCNQLFFDDGGASANYIESTDNTISTETFTICPEDPETQVIFAEFNQFDVAPDDQLVAFNGLTTDPTTQITTAVSSGSGTGSSVADAPGGGSLQASCDNISGCLTFAFTRTNDNIVGAGWTFLAECVARNDYSFPSAGDIQQITTSDEEDCSVDGLIGVSIPIPFYSDCVGNSLIVNTDCATAQLNGISGGTLSADLPLGTTNITFTSPLFPEETAIYSVRVLPINLACNDEIEVSLSSGCVVTLTPDLVLENTCTSSNYTYRISLVDPLRNDLSDVAVVGTTVNGYPVVDFSNVPCGTRVDVVVERAVNIACGVAEPLNSCITQLVLVDRVAPTITQLVDDYLIPCYYETDNLLDYLNGLGNSSTRSIPLDPVGVADFANDYRYDLIINPIASAFEITDNCASNFVVSKWQVVNFDCTTDEFDLEGTFDDDNNPNTPDIPVVQDPLWALMAIEVEDPNGTGGKPAIFQCYFRTVQALDDCGNQSNLAVQRVCVAQPDVVFPSLEIALPCGANPDPINIYNTWLSDPVKFKEYATFLPNYDPTPADLNGNFSLFGNLDDTYFTDKSGDEVPVFPGDGACGYGIDWEDSRQLEVCEKTYKIFREWTVFNFCDGHLEIIDLIPQIVKVGDIAPPTLDFFGIVGQSSIYGECAAQALIQVAIQDDCSDDIIAFVDFLDDDQQEEIGQLTSEGILVSSVPIGELVRFTIRLVDECGNGETYGIFTATLADNIPPVAICESFHTVSLGLSCEVNVLADVFDDGSYDNCGQVSFSVARMDDIGDLFFDAGTDEDGDGLIEGDAEFFEQDVTFTSADLDDCEGTVTVVLRTEDGVGNTNFCMVEVTLQDKLPPRIVDLNMTLDCDDRATQNLIAAALSSEPNSALEALFNTEGMFSDADSAAYLQVVTDNCDNANFLVDFIDVSAFDATCNQGTFAIFYQASDVCGNVSPTQVANITIGNRSDWVMRFPMDGEIFCENNSGAPAAATLNDILTNNGCDFWGLEVEDHFFTGSGSCSKIIREYHLINWCTWHPNNTEIAVVERPQELILSPFYTVALRYRDAFINGTDDNQPDGLNDFDDGNEDGDTDYLYNSFDDRSRFAPVQIPFSSSELDRIFDTNEAENFDPYDVTALAFDADFAVIDFADFPYQNINVYPAISQFSNVQEQYVSAQEYGNILYRQILKINDITPPNIEITQNGPFCGGYDDPGEDGMCSGEVDLKFSISDLCAPNIEVSYELIAFVNTPNQLLIAADPFGELLADGEDYRLNGDYPIGIHQLVIIAEDGCKNKAETTVEFEVKDCKAPSLVCNFGLASDLMVNGEVTIEAEDFRNNVIEFCSEVEVFFADPNIYPDSTSRTFRCLDGEVGVIDVEIYARDEAGNTSFCKTFIRIQQNPQNGNIPDNCPVVGTSILGSVQTSKSEAVNAVSIELSGDMEVMFQTDDAGQFQFIGLPENGDYSITPHKNDDLLNGVSTLDIILISKHILGSEPLTDPYQMIAADINNSGSITTFDMVSLRKAILGIDVAFKNNTSWRFVPTAYEFIDPTYPFDEDFPELINVNDATADELITDFVAIKIGDLNRSVQANNASSTEQRSVGQPLTLEIQNKWLKAGQTYHIPVRANVENMSGYQFTLEVTNADLMSVEAGDLKAGDFAQFDNQMTVSWHQLESSFLEEVAFTLVLKAKENISLSEALKLTSNRTPAIAYDQSNTALDIVLTTISSDIQLAQNQPNPFSQTTTIALYLPETKDGILSIRDLSGRTVYQQQQRWQAGHQTILIEAANLPSGILYYTFETDDFTMTRKMVLLQR